MKWFVLVGLAMVVGCAEEERSPSDRASEQPLSEEGADSNDESPGVMKSSRERWCNSYKSEEYCPSVCVWHTRQGDAPYCGLPSSI